MSELGSASKAKHDRIIMADVDFIIIGAGTAGCILANRLSENPRNSVVLIEAGKADNHPLIHIPAGFVNLMTNSSLNWMLSTCEQEILNNRIMNMPRGKVLGGTSAINGMLYVRGQAQDYDGWAQAGNKGWSFEEVLPYFKKSVQTDFGQLRHDEGFHGELGDLHISPPRTTYAVLDQFIEASGQRGYRPYADYNGNRQDGFNYFQLTQKNGLRHSSYQAFVAPVIKKRQNLMQLSSAHVLAICFADDGQTARGVEIEHKGQKYA